MIDATSWQTALPRLVTSSMLYQLQVLSSTQPKLVKHFLGVKFLEFFVQDQAST